jgi:hypothetical protein
MEFLDIPHFLELVTRILINWKVASQHILIGRYCTPVNIQHAQFAYV